VTRDKPNPIIELSKVVKRKITQKVAGSLNTTLKQFLQLYTSQTISGTYGAILELLYTATTYLYLGKLKKPNIQ
jgi:hypothetical protein